MFLEEDPDVLPIEQALEELRIDRATFYRYASEGRLAKFSHAGKTYTRRTWIDEYKNSLFEAATKERDRRARNAAARRKRRAR